MIELFVTGASFGLTRFLINDDLMIEERRLFGEPVENRESFTLIKDGKKITYAPNCIQPTLVHGLIGRERQIRRLYPNLPTCNEFAFHDGCKVGFPIPILDRILIAVPTLGIVAICDDDYPRIIKIPNYEVINHANSVIQFDDFIFISMHNHAISRGKKSWIGQYRLTERFTNSLNLEEVYRHEIGYDIHSLHETDGYIVLCSSGDGRVMTMAGETLFTDPLNRYVRGLTSVDDEYLIAGYFGRNKQASDRHKMPCGIFILDHNSGKIIKEIELSKAGTIAALHATEV